MSDRAWWAITWTGLAALLVALDYVTGPSIEVPLAFAVPVGLAGWHNGRAWGIGMAVALSAARWFLSAGWGGPALDRWVNAAIAVAALGTLAWLSDRAGRVTREVRVLRAVLRICRTCGRVSDGEADWTPIESYLRRHQEILVSHRVCPDCAAERPTASTG